MRTIFKLIFLFNTVLLMANPYSEIIIVNLSGEDISFTIAFDKNKGTGMNYKLETSLENKKNNLSVSADDPHPYQYIIWSRGDDDDMYPIFNSYVSSLEIFDKNGKLIFNKSTYKRGFVFVRNTDWVYKYGDHHNYGTRYIIILKTDLNRGGLQSSHRTTERLNLRESPSTKAPVKKVIDKGEAVAVTGIGEIYEWIDNLESRFWLKIKLRDGTEGWGVATYLTPIQ